MQRNDNYRGQMHSQHRLSLGYDTSVRYRAVTDMLWRIGLLVVFHAAGSALLLAQPPRTAEARTYFVNGLPCDREHPKMILVEGRLLFDARFNVEYVLNGCSLQIHATEIVVVGDVVIISFGAAAQEPAPNGASGANASCPGCPGEDGKDGSAGVAGAGAGIVTLDVPALSGAGTLTIHNTGAPGGPGGNGGNGGAGGNGSDGQNQVCDGAGRTLTPYVPAGVGGRGGAAGRAGQGGIGGNGGPVYYHPGLETFVQARNIRVDSSAGSDGSSGVTGSSGPSGANGRLAALCRPVPRFDAPTAGIRVPFPPPVISQTPPPPPPPVKASQSPASRQQQQQQQVQTATLRSPPPVSGSGNYIPVPIFYATDRKEAQPGKYIGERSPESKLRLGVAQVSVPRDHRVSVIESPSWWKFEFRPDPERHIVVLSVIPQSYDDFYGALKAKIAGSQKKEAFVFIHGYNVSFEDALRRAAQITVDLKFEGAAIAYSWPSAGELRKYLVDEASIEWTASHLRYFLEDVARMSGAASVNLIAHSMGNRALTNAVKSIVLERAQGQPPPPRFRQIVMAAPDVDTGVFNELAAAVKSAADQVTIYASSSDKALQASREAHDYPRLGEGGSRIVVLPGIDTIDASSVSTDFLDHSYFGDSVSVIGDLFQLIEKQLAPLQRGLSAVTVGEKRYWAFPPSNGR